MSSSQEAAALALAQAVPSQSKSEPAIGPGTVLSDTTTLPPSLPAGTVRLRTQRGRTRTNTISNGAPPPNLQQANAPLPPPTTEKTLRPMRSFHRPRPQNQAEYSHTSLDRSRSQRVPSQQQQLYDQVQVPAVPPLPSTRSRSRPPAVRTAVDEFGAMGLSGGANEMPSRRSNDLPPPRKSTDLPPPEKSTDLPPPEKSTDTVGSRRSGRSSMDHNRPEVPPVELMPALPANLRLPSTDLHW
ncbi:hypothetical protein MPER_02333 [Moniliophthora perniciosa FA553]|nr:hypothetical protein MPER_02333 [Moniliophthora perniciosa FA553]